MRLAAQGRLPPEDRDAIFVTGVLSLADRLMNAPLPALLAHLQLADTMSDALLHRRGIYAPYLALAAAYDSGDDSQVHAAASTCGLNPKQANALYLQALGWAQEVRL